MSQININFLGVGAEKAGTTWLADILRQHPEIFIPEQKELHYFNKYFVEDPNIENMNYSHSFEWYYNFFRNAPKNTVKGEMSPTYLWDSKAANNIYTNFPDTKILIVLRDPIERAFSQYQYYYQKGIIQSETFEQALKDYPYLIERSLYYEQVKRYFDLFPHSNIFILTFEEMMQNKEKYVKQVEKFLGVSYFIPENINERSNSTGTPKYPRINRFLGQTRIFLRKHQLHFIFYIARKTGIARMAENIRNNAKSSNHKPMKLSKEQKISLNNTYFLENIKSLEKLLHINFSSWYKNS